MHLSKLACAVLAAFLLGVLLLAAAAGTTERYGGPIKAIRRLPVSEALAVCNQNFRRCLADTRLRDSSLCMRRHENCETQARYTDFHRM